MNELIKVETISDIQYVSSLRALYIDCGMNKSQWSRWAKGNISSNSFFTENSDYIPLDTVSNHNPVVDFKVSFDMSKHLVMQMRTDKAHEYRNYLINLEKAWNNPEVVMARALQIANTNIVNYQKEVKVLSLKAQVADELVNTDGLYLPSIAGKIITGHPNLFCKWLEDQKIMFHRKNKLLPFAQYTDKYFKVKVTTDRDNNSYSQSFFTARGLAWIKAKYLKANDMLQLDYKEVING